MITSDEIELARRMKRLMNRWNILTLLEMEGLYWAEVAISSNDNQYFPANQYIALYNGENN